MPDNGKNRFTETPFRNIPVAGLLLSRGEGIAKLQERASTLTTKLSTAKEELTESEQDLEQAKALLQESQQIREEMGNRIGILEERLASWEQIVRAMYFAIQAQTQLSISRK